MSTNPGDAGGYSLSQKLLLYLLIATLPFSDFLQNGVVAFNAAPIMGDLGAGPEEYSQVATLYAVVAIAMISLHRWLVEQFGWRSVTIGAGSFFALGALVCAHCTGLLGFALGRVLMALGCSSFLTAGRVLVNHIPPSARRFTGIKFFAAGLAWGVVAGPVVASTAFAGSGWRASFLALTVPAVLVAALAAWTLDNRRPAVHAASQPYPTGLLLLVGSSFLLLHALQRTGFDFFVDKAALYAALALGLPAIGALVWIDARRAHPLIRFRELAHPRYLIGLGVFGICYAVLGANNIMLPVLLQRALGSPLEIVGRYLGLGALAGVVSWIVLSRLLPRNQGPIRYYLVGFAALLLCGWQLSGLGESASIAQSVLPALVCNGVFIIVVLSTTAMQTFQGVQHDEATFSHANQVKNILAQFGIAAGTALATLCMQWRSTVRYVRVAESLTSSNTALQPALDQLGRHFATTFDAVAAPQLALSEVAQRVAQEATFMAATDYFQLLTVVASLALAATILASVWTTVRPRFRDSH